MKTMKIIDLLNKIANEELKKKPNLYNIPNKIKYDDIEYSLLYELGKDGKNYITYSEDNLSEDVYGELEISCLSLNDEVEIIEEPQEHKIPEKIEKEVIEISMVMGEQICANKINEILDYLEVKND